MLKLGARLTDVVLCCVESPMTEMIRPRVKYVIGPDGSPLTIADLPPANTRRWVIRRKAEVVAAVRGGLLSLEEACERYTLTVEEFLSWQASINDHGLAGPADHAHSAIPPLARIRGGALSRPNAPGKFQCRC